jgi:hypothetical protein
VAMMTVDPNEKGAQHKREQIASLINFTEQQKIIVDLYILEENTKERHWDMDPEDPNIYLEWMNGTNVLRNKINNRLNMTREQKRIAMNNNSQQQQIANNNGNNLRKQQQPPIPQKPKETITTSSGKEYKISERPDLVQAATHKPAGPTPGPKKGYPRYRRS